MPGVETALTCPLTMIDGTLLAQVAIAFDTPTVQRIQVALGALAEYVVNVESSTDTSYADRAYFARLAASDPAFWAQTMAWTIVADSATITVPFTDQALLNRIWTVWPVFSYKKSTLPVPAGTSGP